MMLYKTIHSFCKGVLVTGGFTSTNGLQDVARSTECLAKDSESNLKWSKLNGLEPPGMIGINQHEMVFVHETTGIAAVYLVGGQQYQEDMIGVVTGDILKLESGTSGWTKSGKMLYPRHSHRSWVTYDFDEQNPTFKGNTQFTELGQFTDIFS